MALTLQEVAATSRQVAATSSKKAKVALLADLLRRADDTEVAIVATLLAGTPRQGRIGVGWATLGGIELRPGAGGGVRTVRELDTLLDALAPLSGSGSVAARTAQLAAFMEPVDGAELDLIRQVLLGGLRQGALEGLMVEAIAASTAATPSSVRRALMLAGDLGTVAVTARHGPAALAAVGLVVGRPLRPMLAASSPDVATAVGELGTASVEWKLDGARVQVHRDGTSVAVFTRNLNEITDRLPGVTALVAALPARRFVLDGELIGMTERTVDALEADPGGSAAPQLFQDTISRFATRSPAGSASDGRSGDGREAASTFTLSPFFFDCLHVDGEDLVDQPLRHRLAALDRVVGTLAVPRLVTDDAAAGTEFAADAVARGHEGVVVKALDAPYAAGRRGATWRKVKPVHTLDLVVLAAEWGHGRRRGRLSNLHLGARHPHDAERFVMVGKTFKGLTDELLAWQTEQLLARQIRREGITVFVRPELVVEIALDGVQRSVRYPGGVALRFARVRRYRDDKSAAEADLITTVQAMLAGSEHLDSERPGS